MQFSISAMVLVYPFSRKFHTHREARPTASTSNLSSLHPFHDFYFVVVLIAFFCFFGFCYFVWQVYFGSLTVTAITELNASIRRSLRSVFRTVESPPPEEFLTSPNDFLGAWRNVTEISPPPFFSSEEEDYIVEQYKIQGFEYSAYIFFTLPVVVFSLPIALALVPWRC